ncbi:hypothetical protein BSKO_05583 [Bryopsis sp. KO-2023]|nr:hypothetical protein BSKO_05583 [Bryopsis sp. KO-2023]
MCERGLGWGSLPAEALFGVYSALDFSNVCACAVVCKHWRCVSDAPLLWGQFLRDVSKIPETELPSVDAKASLVRLVTSRLYTWGGKVLDFPGTTTRNRLTSPTLVPATILGPQIDAHEIDDFPTGLLASELSQRHVDVRKVVAGENFGVLLSWGGKVTDTRSYDRDLGDRVVVSRAHLFPRWWSPPGERVLSIAAGGGGGSSHGGHVLAVTSSGEVWSWGSNSHGQLGLGTIDKSVQDPSRAFELGCGRKLVGAACGKTHSVVWSADGQLYACGDNSKGACGMEAEQELVPVFLEVDLPAAKVIDAACGDAITIVCSEEGGVWVAGDNPRSQCGPRATHVDECFEFVWIDPDTAWNSTNKTKVKDSPQQLKTAKVVQVAAASATLYALTDSGEVYAWGRGSLGELGTGGASKFQPIPAKLPWAARINTICGSAGGRFAAAVDAHGRLYTWGEGKFGQLGHGDTNKRTTGRAVKSLYRADVTSIACGSDFMMGITSWKSGSKHKNPKSGDSVLTPSNSEIRAFTPSRSMEEEILASSYDGSFKYIEIKPILSSSPMSFSPGFSPGHLSRRMRKPRRNQLPLGLEFGAASIEGEASDIELGCSPGSFPSRNPPRQGSRRSRNDFPSSPENQPINSNVPAGAIPIPASSNRLSLEQRCLQISASKKKSKSEKRFHAMLRRQVKALANDPSAREMFFPADLSSVDRYKVHEAAERLGLLHESVGEDPNRQIRIWKPLMRKAPRGAPMSDIHIGTLDSLKIHEAEEQDAGVFETAMEL